MPVDSPHIVSMLEGNTPLVPSGRLGPSLGLNHLYFKDESRNPTWSFKDRLGSVVVSKAVEFGARVITDSSTGNQGAASASHAARAGLPAVIFTHRYSPSTMHILMRIFGAFLIVTREPGDRIILLRDGVDRYGWFPTCNIADPPVGSNPWGIEGYKTIAYEICQQLNWQLPQAVFFPTDFGDGITGMFKAFNELIEVGFVEGSPPRMYAVERFGPLANALAKGLDFVERVPTASTAALSIATSISTYQALYTLRKSGGRALTVEEGEFLEAQVQMATQESLFIEPSSAVAYAGLARAVRSGLVHPDERIVMVITSSGLKTPEVPIAHLGLQNLLPIGAEIAELHKLLNEHYGFDPVEYVWGSA